MGVVASAPAEVMLFGEHFAVYGEPAIVLAINKRAYAKAGPCVDGQVCFRSVNSKISGHLENETFRNETGNTEEVKQRFAPLKLARAGQVETLSQPKS